MDYLHVSRVKLSSLCNHLYRRFAFNGDKRLQTLKKICRRALYEIPPGYNPLLELIESKPYIYDFKLRLTLSMKAFLDISDTFCHEG